MQALGCRFRRLQTQQGVRRIRSFLTVDDPVTVDDRVTETADRETSDKEDCCTRINQSPFLCS